MQEEVQREHRPADDPRPGRAGAGHGGVRRGVEQAVNELTGYIVGGVIALLVTIYLFAAMLFPEKF